MQCSEKGKICLNYAFNVPEWQLDMTLDALAALGAAVSACGKVQKAVAGDLAWIKRHPNSMYMGTEPIDRARACNEAATALGRAVYALEVILCQSSQFGFAHDLARAAQTGYNVEHVALETRCREHGCEDVAYKHG
jgi:hypothetical protein